jgi:hypothetical protein
MGVRRSFDMETATETCGCGWYSLRPRTADIFHWLLVVTIIWMISWMPHGVLLELQRISAEKLGETSEKSERR